MLTWAWAFAAIGAIVLGGLWFVNKWEDGVRRRSHNDHGADLQDHGELEEAIAEYRAAIRLVPEFCEAHNNLGSALQARGKLDEAIAEYRAAIRLKPDDARRARPASAPPSRTRASTTRPLTEFNTAIRIKPDHALAHYNLGIALQSPGEAGGGGRRIPRGDPDQARLRRRPQQPGQRPG